MAWKHGMATVLATGMMLSAAGSGHAGEAGNVKAGEKVYQDNCLICHGPGGDGKGAASAGLSPMPRDFTREDFKFKSTPKGVPPTDADVIKTIKDGSPGTSMPPWGAALSAAQMKDVLAYIKTFNPKYWAGRSAKAAK